MTRSQLAKLRKIDTATELGRRVMVLQLQQAQVRKILLQIRARKRCAKCMELVDQALKVIEE